MHQDAAGPTPEEVQAPPEPAPDDHQLPRRVFSRRTFFKGLGVLAVTGVAMATVPSVAETLVSHRPGRIAPGFLRTRGRHIIDSSGNVVRFAGVNWYGMETNSLVPGGLDHRSLDEICRKIVGLGFNSIRLPYCVQAVLENPALNEWMEHEPTLMGSRYLDIMDALIETAGHHGLKVMIDSHMSEPGFGPQGNGIWFTDKVSEDDWLRAWMVIARRYRGNRTVVAFDLHNEPYAPASGDPLVLPTRENWPPPHGSLWGEGGPKRDWASAAERCGNAILAVNPDALIVVEGVAVDLGGPHQTDLVGYRRALNAQFPGGNLIGVGAAGGDRLAPRPIRLNVANRLVYSAHAYGPNMAPVPWAQLTPPPAMPITAIFGPTAYSPYTTREILRESWGYIAEEDRAPVILGEFGTDTQQINGKPLSKHKAYQMSMPNAENAQGDWLDATVGYIDEIGASWFYWAINGTQTLSKGRHPKNAEVYGILDATWTEPASRYLMTQLQRIQGPPGSLIERAVRSLTQLL